MTQTIGYQVDVSQFQRPSLLAKFAGKVDQVIVRACYGAEHADPVCLAHVKAARAIDAKVGCYLFYRPSQSVDAQFEAFARQMEAAGVGTGDLCPVIDIENDEHEVVVPAWNAPLQLLAQKLATAYGRVVLYISPAAFAQLGHPAWVLEHDIWAAAYNAGTLPPSFGGKLPIAWQHLVGLFDPTAPGGERDKPSDPGPAVDQSRLFAPWPRIPGTIAPPAPVPPSITPEDVAKVDAENTASLEAQARAVVNETEPTSLA